MDDRKNFVSLTKDFTELKIGMQTHLRCFATCFALENNLTAEVTNVASPKHHGTRLWPARTATMGACYPIYLL
jgi:hypothetical protein